MEAIPTVFRGIQYRSRLEARFAEFLTEQRMHYAYEPNDEFDEAYCMAYKPDFAVYPPLITPALLSVEVKPLAFLSEIDLFWDDIRATGEPWICVDQLERGTWSIIGPRFNFLIGVHIPVPNVLSFRVLDGSWQVVINGLAFDMEV